VEPVPVVTFEGEVVRLEPLGPEHVPGLVRAASADRATYRFTTVPDGRVEVERYIAKALAERDAGISLPFATVAGGEVVGSTRFMNIERWDWPAGGRDPDAVEIGSTWLSAAAQRTAVNAEAKLLMLAHAFEVWQVQRVTLKTDARNERSRRAIERLGGHLDGVLRAWQPASDAPRPRDTAIYSILASEWPGVRDGLSGRLASR